MDLCCLVAVVLVLDDLVLLCDDGLFNGSPQSCEIGTFACLN
jgi:hypothetical protein